MSSQEISIHPPRAGRDSSSSASCAVSWISIHPPRAGRDVCLTDTTTTHQISIHPPRAGRDRITRSKLPQARNFNPPAPCGAGPIKGIADFRIVINFNPPAPCGAGPFKALALLIFPSFQSTRPVRGGTHTNSDIRPSSIISIHPPRAGRDLILGRFIICTSLFQSTRPVRGGTETVGSVPTTPFPFQSTRPVRGGTDLIRLKSKSKQISIHPPRAGRDHREYRSNPEAYAFQSTRPVRGGTGLF